ncbi:5-azacytidine-induced protein 2 isoform X2 [Egretta garzetta]|uniref:5-azacytidine-induced protein 2 isoform X2 n=1 Tax=Egretta garzetta TaxID=188379 RepID=UPI00163C9970|nr:5-azacytidine-induced protein 2 isoform X2 [Egretta garzetta]
MEELVEDDICILNHEKADNAHKRDGEIPVPSYSGDESVASHFALVTAYEDIKKRLKETEKENSSLKKRVRILEEKLLGSRLEEECSSVGREQVNKAYQAYREACIDRDNLKSKLDKMMKESAESLKTLNEQLQSKEVELLQLRTEVETQQVMKNLHCTQSSWEIEKLSSDLKVHSLEQDLEKLKEECNSLRQELQKSKQKDQAQDENPLNADVLQRQDIQSVQQAYWELKREMSNLRLVTDVQAEVLRKLKTNPTATKKVVVLTVFRIQKMLVKDGELGYNMLVTVSDVPVHYKIKTFLFLNSLDWLGEKAIGFTPGQSLPLSVGSSDEWSLSGPWLINYPHAF